MRANDVCNCSVADAVLPGLGGKCVSARLCDWGKEHAGVNSACRARCLMLLVVSSRLRAVWPNADVPAPFGFARPRWKVRFCKAARLGEGTHAGVNSRRLMLLVVSSLLCAVWPNDVTDAPAPFGFARPRWKVRFRKSAPVREVGDDMLVYIRYVARERDDLRRGA